MPFTERAVINIKLRRPLFYIIISVLVVLVLSFALWHVAIPVKLIELRIGELFLSKGIIVNLEGIRKGLFYSISVEAVTFYSLLEQGKPAFDMDSGGKGQSLTLLNLRAGLDLSSLVRLRPSIDINSSSGTGIVRGNLSLFDRKLTIEFEGIDLSDVGLTKEAGLDGKGILSGKGSFYLNDSRAALRFSINNMTLKDIVRDGYIPLSFFNQMRGYLEIHDSIINIHSLSFEGKGVYGRIQDAQLRIQNLQFLKDSNLTLMVNSDFPMPRLIDLALLRYKRSTGYFIIPLRGL